MTKYQVTASLLIAVLAAAMFAGCSSQQAATAPPPPAPGTAAAASEPLGVQAASMAPAQRAQFLADLQKKTMAARQGVGPGAANPGNPKAYAVIMNHMSFAQQQAFLAKHAPPPVPAAAPGSAQTQ